MGIVEFTFNEIITKMKCNINEKMGNICKRFSSKIDKDINNLYFLYNEKKINEEYTFNQQVNIYHKNGKIINIFVYEKNFYNSQNKKKKGNVICPICKESIIIEIKDYNIKLYECKNSHIIDNIQLNEYDNTQKNHDYNILCDKCKIKNKENSNEFYKCLTCKKNLCQFCKLNHNKNHIIINYENQNYICNFHNKKYNSFCQSCKLNICHLCEFNHYNHKIISFKNIMPNKSDLLFKLNELKMKINKLCNNIYNIIIIFNKIMENMRKYYEINNDIINNYDFNRINFQILKSINEKNICNVIEDIDKIIEENNKINKLRNILEIYNKMKNYINDDNENNIYNNRKNKNLDLNIGLNTIKLIYRINKKNIVKIFGKNFIKNNRNNCKIIYDGEEYYLTENFKIPNDKINNDTIEIKLKYNNNIINMSEIFHNCSSLILTPDISKLNTDKITNMSCLFSGCTSLSSLPDISKWNTINVTDMSYMFYRCSLLLSLPDISKWNTKNIKFINNMFENCSSLINLPDISKWNTLNFINMNNIFNKCSSLLYLPDISKWKTFNVKDISGIFCGCSSLKYLPDISKWNTKNIINMSSVFYNCTSLISLPDISKWNISNVIDMSKMFYGCISLEYFPNISKWKISNVKNTENMFKDCKSSFNFCFPNELNQCINNLLI